MARYEYRCPTCTDRFEIERPMNASAEPVLCPSGHGEARRVFSPVASLGGAAPAATPMAGGGGCCGGACGC